ncbi:MAG: DUF5667 domain-containing protein, partial [Nanoarchaeota archaeon]
MLINKKNILNILFFGVLLVVLIFPITSAQETVTTDPGVTPDSLLWGLDKALDQIALLLTTGDVDKAKKGLEIAEERLAEIKIMIEENKLREAGKAQDAHGKILLKIKEKVKEVDEDESLEEVEKVIEIEKELEDHNENVEQTFEKLKVKIEIRRDITQEQKDLIDSILNSIQEQTEEVKIEIKNKKNKIKIEIKKETGKSEEKIEIEIEDIEKEKGIKKREKASEAIKDVREEIDELKERINVTNTSVSVLKLLEESESKLENAIKAFDEKNFGESYGQANAAERLAKNALRKLEGKYNKENGDSCARTLSCINGDGCCPSGCDFNND